MKTKLTFEEYMRKDNLSENTITSYLWTVNYFTENYDAVSKENLLAYKGYLMEFFSSIDCPIFHIGNTNIGMICQSIAKISTFR